MCYKYNKKATPYFSYLVLLELKVGWAEDKDHQQSLQDREVHEASVNLLFLNSIYRCLQPWELKRQKENNKQAFHYAQLWDKSLGWMIR